MSTAIDADRKWLFRSGGVSAISIGVGYILIIALYVPMGAPPAGSEARLAYLADHTTAWWTIVVLSVITDLLFLPVALSLYDALRQLNRNAMVLATGCVALFVVLDLAITWTNGQTMLPF